MKSNLKKIIIFILIINVFFSNTNNLLAQDNSIQINLGVSGCNNNGVCEIDENILSCPVDCAIIIPPAPPGSVGPIYVNVLNLNIQPNFTNAFISWNSSISSLATIKWGETTEVKEGTLKSIVYDLNHKMEIINLKPGTMYYFIIESLGINGRTNTYPPTYFFTKFLEEDKLPSNPTNVKIYSDKSGITINWENPKDENFSYIRIMRHEDKFRGNPYLGKLVYEGIEEKFLDKNVIPGKKYFYSLFSKYIDDSFSSGVAIFKTAYLEKKIIIEKPTDKPEQTEEEKKREEDLEEKNKTEIPIIKTPTEKNIIEITPEEYSKKETFFIHQYHQLVEELSSEKIIILDGEKETIIDTNAKTFPEDFIVVKKENEVVGQYLFLFNKKTKLYQGTISPLEKEGLYTIEIYRYKENILTKIKEGKVLVKENLVDKMTEIKEKSNLLENNLLLYILILLLTLFLLFVYFNKRRKKHIK